MGPVCIRFTYHVYGDGIGSLLVYTRFHGGPANPVFNQTGQLGDRWIEAAVDAVLIYAESVRHSATFCAFTVAVRNHNHLLTYSLACVHLSTIGFYLPAYLTNYFSRGCRGVSWDGYVTSRDVDGTCCWLNAGRVRRNPRCERVQRHRYRLRHHQTTHLRLQPATYVSPSPTNNSDNNNNNNNDVIVILVVMNDDDDDDSVATKWLQTYFKEERQD